MAAQTGLTIVKAFEYRSAVEEFSNQYWFTGDVPADAAAWTALFDALVLQEKTIYPALVTVVRGYGYASDADDATAVWVHDIAAAPVAGTLVTTGGNRQAGDAAVWARWKTSRTNTKGRAIYLRKYYHPAYATTADEDTVLTLQRNALFNFGAKMSDGTFLSARTITARGHTDTIVNYDRSLYVTTRTLKRRGKRPGS